MSLLWRQRPGAWPEDRPRAFGRYTLLGRVAVGGMAEVFAATVDAGMGPARTVALKVIHEHLSHDEAFVSMFIDEARIAMHLAHPNVVSVLDLARDGEAYGIALEWVDGVDLGEAIARLRESRRIFPPEIIALIGAEAAKGLHHAHERTNAEGEPLEIVHRDVTPANVMVSFDGDVKVTDFGVARARSRLSSTRPGVLKGKLAYIAPEAYACEPVDRRADVFGLGVVLYELMTGNNPFAGATSAEVIYRVRSGRFTRPSEVVPVYAPLEAIALAALESRPQDRPQTAGEVARALTDVMARLADQRGAFVRRTALADRIRMAFAERGLPRVGRPAIPSEAPTEDFSMGQPDTARH